ncbi:hypothetical protein [Desulfosporosinus sp.]|uniref:hypothetical protein n=1 Tax=Desulfosporosinus sp. TaxID=157907 RepID=UPI0026016ED3|nr:hypothetical protein [Desulfosporosinus sp.]
MPCGDGHKGCCCGSQCGQLLIVADRIPGKEYGVCKIVALLVTLPLDRANFLAHLTDENKGKHNLFGRSYMNHSVTLKYFANWKFIDFLRYIS